jgi:ABC-type amino acid transport substrate-binding protein
MHVAARKGHPEAQAYLTIVNAGLAKLRAPGRWSDVVTRHFGAHGVIVQ